MGWIKCTTPYTYFTKTQIYGLMALEELIGPPCFGIHSPELDFDLWLKTGVDLGLLTALEAKCIHEELFPNSFPKILGYTI